MKRPPPRLYCLPAAEAPILVVFRRGPSQWAHVGHWDLAQTRYEPGGWLGGASFPAVQAFPPTGAGSATLPTTPSAWCSQLDSSFNWV